MARDMANFLPYVSVAIILFLYLGAEASETGAAASGRATSHDAGPAEKLKVVRDEILTAIKLPEESQKALLSVMGATLAASGQLACNIFGGKGACQPIPMDSTFARRCPAASKVVDCAFKSAALEEISDDPSTQMREKLAKEGYPPCDTCFDALHGFWCAQTVPTCGTFESVLDELLPVFGDVAMKSKSPVDAVQLAVPRMLEALSLGLPCREMCQHITQTCGCGKPATFGHMMTMLHRDRARPLGLSTNMSASTAKEIFRGVWDRPVCDLFAPRNMPGFAGVCDAPPLPPAGAAAGMCTWCNAKAKQPGDVTEQIAAQMAQSMSGMMQMGLQRILESAGAAKAHHHMMMGMMGGGGGGGGHTSKSWDWDDEVTTASTSSSAASASSGAQGQTQGRPAHHGGGAVVFTVLLLMAAGLAAIVAVGWVLHLRQRAPSMLQQQQQYVDLNSMGYSPPPL